MCTGRSPGNGKKESHARTLAVSWTPLVLATNGTPVVPSARQQARRRIRDLTMTFTKMKRRFDNNNTIEFE